MFLARKPRNVLKAISLTNLSRLCLPVFIFISLSANAKSMKTMTCKQLGGACNQTFSANTFDEIAMMVSKHGREMVQQGDAAHIEAMNDMRNIMTSPEAINTWM